MASSKDIAVKLRKYADELAEVNRVWVHGLIIGGPDGLHQHVENVLYETIEALHHVARKIEGIKS